MSLATLVLLTHTATAASAGSDPLLNDRDREVMQACWRQVGLGATSCPTADSLLNHIQAYPAGDLVRSANEPFDSELALPLTFIALRAGDRMQRGDMAGAAADATFLLGVSEAALDRPQVSPDLLQVSLSVSQSVTEQLVEAWSGPVPVELATLLAVPPRSAPERAALEFGACSWEAVTWSSPAFEDRSRRFAREGQSGQAKMWVPLALARPTMLRLMNDACDRTLADRLGLAPPPSPRVTLVERLTGLSSLRAPHAMPLLTHDLFGSIGAYDAARLEARAALDSGTAHPD